MNYQKIYNQLIKKRQTDKIYKKNGYCESHHITPKSLGGSNKKENLVNLTAREHFIAHLLLAKIHGNKMIQALWYMLNNGKYKKNSHTYELNKKHYSKMCKERIFTEETRKKISLATSGKNNPYFGVKHSDEIRDKMSKNQWLKNGKCTDEYREKMSKSIISKNAKLLDTEKEFFTKTRSENPAFGKNYNINKTKSQLEEIKFKKQITNNINKDNHLHKSGKARIIISGISYNNINDASKKLGYSFKYIKRRVLSKDYKDYFFE